MHTIYSVEEHSLHRVAPITEKVNINGTAVIFEIDTGCGVTVINRDQYSKL